MQRDTSHLRLRRRLVRCCVALHHGTIKGGFLFFYWILLNLVPRDSLPILREAPWGRGNIAEETGSQVIPQINPTVQFNSTQTQSQGQLKTANAPVYKSEYNFFAA